MQALSHQCRIRGQTLEDFNRASGIVPFRREILVVVKSERELVRDASERVQSFRQRQRGRRPLLPDSERRIKVVPSRLSLRVEHQPRIGSDEVSFRERVPRIVKRLRDRQRAVTLYVADRQALRKEPLGFTFLIANTEQASLY